MSWDLASHEGLPYRFVLPPGYDPFHQRYPLVVFLHGSGEKGTDTTSHLVNGVQAFEGQPFITVAPQCPIGDTWGGSWYGGDSTSQRALVSLVRELTGRRSVDPSRVHLVGYSMGAIGAWAIIERYTELFASAVPIAGDLEPESARSLTQFPIWAFHGQRDKLVRPDNTRRVAKLMRERGNGVFRYTEFEGVGHDAWRPTFEHPDLMTWLLSQRRA
jgi:predicted peptidase